MSLKNKFLSFILPKHIKRMIFISSLLAHIRGNDHINPELLFKLNQLLSLSKNEQALIMPMKWHEMIWKDLNLSLLTNQENLLEIERYEILSQRSRIVSEKILNMLPSWLRYDNNRAIKADIMLLFLNINTILDLEPR